MWDVHVCVCIAICVYVLGYLCVYVCACVYVFGYVCVGCVFMYVCAHVCCVYWIKVGLYGLWLP